MERKIHPLQQAVFDKIREKISSQRDLPAELAEILDISIHSAYRRLRHDVVLSVAEMDKLVTHYNLNMGTGELKESSSVFEFYGRDLKEDSPALLDNVRRELDLINDLISEGDLHVTYSGLDVVPAFLYGSPVLLAFTHFFWTHCFGGSISSGGKLFCIEEISEETKELANAYFEASSMISSTNILNASCLETVLSQIEYMRDIRCFKSDADAVAVYNDLRKSLDFYERQAAMGRKLHKDGSVKEPHISCTLYRSELFFAESSTLIETAKSTRVALKQNQLFNIFTSQTLFVSSVRDYLQTCLKKSKPISATNEKGRVIFFNDLRRRVEQSETKI